MKPFGLFARLALAAVVGCTLAPSASFAGPLDIYGGPLVTDALKNDPRACQNLGDAISCSAGMMNVLTGRSPTAKTTDASPGYILDSPQGALKTRIVLGATGQAALDNDDIDPATKKVEDGFKTNVTTGPNEKFTATGQTGQTAGNLNDPGNNLLNPNWDRRGTWDVSIEWLIAALTNPAGVRNELMIGFDYNQSQNATSSLNYWALISVLDYDGNSGTILNEKTFEINNNMTGVGAFTST